MAANSSNPFLNQKFWEFSHNQQTMSYEGCVSKTISLFGVMLLAAAIAAVTAADNPALMSLYWFGGMIGAFTISLFLWFAKPENPQLLIIPHAFLEGLFVGGVSMFFESAYGDGIVINAGMITIGIVGSMFAFFKFSGFRASRGFNMVLGSAVMAILFVYIANIVLSFGFGMSVPFLHSSGPIGILVSLIIIGVASLTLISDFTFIENGVQAGYPEKYEWYGAHGLLVSVVWIYFEVLRLLAKLNQR